jgi:hypothetical protein
VIFYWRKPWGFSSTTILKSLKMECLKFPCWVGAPTKAGSFQLLDHPKIHRIAGFKHKLKLDLSMTHWKWTIIPKWSKMIRNEKWPMLEHARLFSITWLWDGSKLQIGANLNDNDRMLKWSMEDSKFQCKNKLYHIYESHKCLISQTWEDNGWFSRVSNNYLNIFEAFHKWEHP